MLNSKPNNDKYHNGNYIPKNKDKVLKLNSEGGIYYRSSWEKKIMIYLDLNESIIKWGAENLAIPYQMTHFEKGDLKVKGHCYYPDFYYEIKSKDGTIKTVVAEVKPKSEYNDAEEFSVSITAILLQSLVIPKANNNADLVLPNPEAPLIPKRSLTCFLSDCFSCIILLFIINSSLIFLVLLK